MNNYSITLVEVDEVLHHLSSQNFNKIPKGDIEECLHSMVNNLET